MKYSIKLIAVAYLLFSSFWVAAQNDSSRLDAGSLVLKRAFTQYISIKGEDLEKMPFANLTEAINVWLNGNYTVFSNLVYIVDGNTVSDVNAYSIHDIEEVIFLQNAGALTGTAGNQQQTILITTRKGKEKFGIKGASQTFLVHGPGTASNLYHQYYIGAYKNLDKISFDLSANYLRDVDPLQKQSELTITKPYNLNRWRFNGSVVWRPDAGNTIEVHMGYTPQSVDSAKNASHLFGSELYHFNVNMHEHTNLLTPWARWYGEWLPGLKNDLQAGYLYERAKGHYLSQTLVPDSVVLSNQTTADANLHTDHWYIRDRVSYRLQAGNWVFEPSINASYEHIKESYYQLAVSQSGATGSGGLGGGIGNVGTNSGYEDGGIAKLWVLTPTLDITYKQILYIQGGMVSNISHVDTTRSTRVPRTVGFASVAVDISRMAHMDSRNSLKLFGSYARRSAYTVTDYYLNDLGGLNTVFYAAAIPNSGYTVVGSVGGVGGGASVLLPLGTPPPAFWVWQAGVHYSTFKDRVQVNYNFERRNFASVGLDISSSSSPRFLWRNWKSSQHSLNVMVRAVDGPVFTWQTGINTTILRSKPDIWPQEPELIPIGDHAKDNHRPSWAGGWVNRLQYRNLSAGLDLLYHFSGEVENLAFYPAYGRDNSWLIQNIYIGYRVHMSGRTGLELYVDSRGLVRGGNTSYDMDSRRYYGVGGKITM